MQRRAEKQLEGLRSELDPDGSHGARKVYAALTYVGVKPEDLEAGFADKGQALHEKVPKDRQDEIRDQRKSIREGLRQQRVQQVREALQGLTEDDVRRLERCRGGGGIRPVTEADLPPTEEIDGVADILDRMERNKEEVRRQQERKAKMICVDFLTNKKRAEDADAQIKALEDRLIANKKAKSEEWKLKRTNLQKAQEGRTAKVNKSKEERDEWEQTTLKNLNERLSKARATRAETYSTETLAKKMGAASAKREKAFDDAVAQEAELLASIQERQARTEERLARDRAELADRLEQRRQDQHQAYMEKMRDVEIMKQEWCEQKAASHKAYMDKFNTARSSQKAFMKERSKSTSDIAKKAKDKWKSNHDRLMTDKGNNDNALMDSLRAAEHKVEYELKPMKLKCGGDVFSHLEVKEKTFGDLVARRRAELTRSQDAKTQALLLKLGERQARDTALELSNLEVRNKRVEAAKENLRYSNEASQVFLKIKCEPNEDRIARAMGGLGFKMPKVGRSADEEVAAES